MTLCKTYMERVGYGENDYMPSGREGKHIAFCYVVYNPITGLHKIGITNNIEKRVRSLALASGVNLTMPLLLELEEGYDEPARYVEKFIHQHFYKKNVIGEWFALSDHDLREIRDLFNLIFGFNVVDELGD